VDAGSTASLDTDLLDELSRAQPLYLSSGMLLSTDWLEVVSARGLHDMASQSGAAALVAWRQVVSANDAGLAGLDERMRRAVAAASLETEPSLGVFDMQGRLVTLFELQWPSSDAAGRSVIVVRAGDAPPVPANDSETTPLVANVLQNLSAGGEYEASTCLRDARVAGVSFVASREDIARVMAIPEVTHLVFTADGAGPWWAPSQVHQRLVYGRGGVSFVGEGIYLQALVYSGDWQEVGWFPATRGDAWPEETDFVVVSRRP
jgi:hypothetical protein